MDIIGRGFLARNLAPIANRHPDVVVAAAGVSAPRSTAKDAFGREFALLDELVARCARTGEKLVFFSTASTGIYSRPGQPGSEEATVVPATPYGRHKHALEQVLAGSDIDYLTLRLGHVVGPDQPPHQLLPALAAQVRSGAVRLVPGARRDLIDVADVITIIDWLLAAGTSRTTVNVASGTAVPIEHIVEHIQRRLGLEAVWHYQEPAVTQAICTRKLRSLVPGVERMGFGPDYYRGVIDKYLAAELPGELVRKGRKA